MRKIVALSVLLLGVSWAAAQDPASQSSPSAAGSSPGASQSAPSSAGGETTVQGCLSGSNGSYTISDNSGNSYQLTGDTSKLSEHVGQEVKITGTSAADGSSASAGSSGSTPSSAGSAGGASQQTLQVSSIKQVSKTCQSGAAAK